MQKQLVAAGFDKSAAGKYAQVVQRGFSVLANRVGMSAMDLLKRYSPSVVRELEADAMRASSGGIEAAQIELRQSDNSQATKKMMEAWTPSPVDAPRVNGDDPSAVWAEYKKSLLGKTLTTPIGLTFTLKPGHFFRLVAGTPSDGSKKGHVAKASSAEDALAMLDRGELEAGDIAGYEPGRAANINIFRHLLQDPDLIVKEAGGAKQAYLFLRRFHTKGRPIFFGAMTDEGGRGLGLQSFYGATNLTSSKLNRMNVVWSRTGLAEKLGIKIDQGRSSEELQPHNGIIDQTTGEVKGFQQSPMEKLPDTIDIDGVQRPTMNSNGQPIHPTEEGVRNFWKWFGDSKAVDDQGRPMVVYHGTNADFNEFRISEGMYGEGVYLAKDPEYSAGFADQSGGNIMPLYAKITGQGDGRILPDKRGGVFVAFSPTQIKSATGNRGTFDPNEPKILYQAQNKMRLDGDSPVHITQAETIESQSIHEARRWARENLQGKTFVNRQSGMSVFVGRKAIEKMTSHSAVSKSDDGLQVIAVRNLQSLVEHAVLGESHPDRDLNPDLASIHRFYAPINIEGHIYRTKITVKEYTNQPAGAYSLEIVKIEMPARNLVNHVNDVGSTTHAGTMTVRNLMTGVKKNDGSNYFIGDSQELNQTSDGCRRSRGRGVFSQKDDRRELLLRASLVRHKKRVCWHLQSAPKR